MQESIATELILTAIGSAILASFEIPSVDVAVAVAVFDSAIDVLLVAELRCAKQLCLVMTMLDWNVEKWKIQPQHQRQVRPKSRQQ